MKHTKYYLYLVILLGFGLYGNYASAIDDEEPLMPEDAFPAEVSTITSDTISVRWKIADKYYMYRSKFRFMTDAQSIQLHKPELPPGKLKTDEFFGEVETYRGVVTVNVPYSVSGNMPATLTLTSISQGCADLGICYPPFKQEYEIKLPVNQAATAPITNPVATLSSLAKSLISDNTNDDFLQPDQAFQLTASNDKNNMVHLNFTVADGYYLYRDKIKATIADHSGNIKLGKLQLPDGIVKADEYFGNVSVFYNSAKAWISVTNSDKEIRPFKLAVQYQGCADAGLCYPPIKKIFDLNVTPSTKPTKTVSAAIAQTIAVPGETKDLLINNLQPVNQPASAPENNIPSEEKIAEQDRLASFLLEKPLWLSALLFFGLGILLAFTPCVFPMIPILSGIIIGQGKNLSTKKAFTLSLVYVLAMALTYTVVGVIAGLFGANLQAVFQDPIIIGIFATIFVLLSLSMFGFYELQMPTTIQSRLAEISNSQQGGTLAGVAIMGTLSAIIVGPCITAPLLGALIVIGQAGDAILGGIALFALSMGMGLPLLLIGTSAGKLLPKAGAWMDAVKSVFGVGLLAVAIWLLERVIPGPAGLFLWAMLFIVSAIYMGALDPLKTSCNGWQKLWKGVGITMFIWGVLMVIGSSTGSRDMLNPLKNLKNSGNLAMSSAATHLDFTRIKSIEDFKRELATANVRGQYVMLDFYADWCIYCIQMEERTFPDAGVQKTLAGVHLLQADVTANDETDAALLKHFGLIAPPAILFFTPRGQERKNYRVVGFQGPDVFKKHLSEALHAVK